MKLSWSQFIASIKLLLLLLLVWIIVGSYCLVLTWTILDYLSAVVELAQLPDVSLTP